MNLNSFLLLTTIFAILELLVYEFILRRNIVWYMSYRRDALSRIMNGEPLTGHITEFVSDVFSLIVGFVMLLICPFFGFYLALIMWIMVAVGLTKL